MPDNKNGCLETIGLLVVIAVNVVLSAVLQGYILYCAWGWFVVPLGVSQIGIMHGFGLAMTAKIFTHGMGKPEEKTTLPNSTSSIADKVMEVFVTHISAQLMIWLILYLIHLWM